MRISVEDIHKHKLLEKAKVTVLLDGKKCGHVIVADEDEGYVDRYVTNEDGRVQLEEDGSDAAQERVYGDVELILEG